MSDEAPIKWETSDHIAVLTLNRPQALNAFSLELMDEHARRLEEFEADDDLWVLIYTGEGRAFCAGVDIRKSPEYLRWGPKERIQKWATPYTVGLTKPTIAAVNGYAFGGGCELLMTCDIRIASENAVFGLPEARLATIPGSGGTQLLPRIVGLGDALMLLMTGESIPAAEALRLHLVQKVVPHEDLMDEAMKMATAICRNGQTAVRLAKEVATLGLSLPLDEALWLEQVYFQRNRALAGDEIDQRLRDFNDKSKKK
jgi:enoyl-CoA hydratase/carnithine racemase